MLTNFGRGLGIGPRLQFRLALRGIAIVIGIGSGYAVALLMAKSLFWWSALPFALLVVSSIFEFILADIVAERSYPIETEKKLALLERRLGIRAVQSISQKLERIIQSFKACDRSRVSGTVHVIVELASSPEGKTRFGLLQLTDYVGPRGGSKGRITTFDQGIIGRCARTGRIEHVNFADEAEYRRRMMDEFGFSKQEADSHTAIARSYNAVPLLLDSRVVGILYLFSTDPQVFPLAARDSNLTASAQDVLDVLRTASIV
ncbi:GAF domain-containing protein [Acidobacteria bacterium AH-259-D05]|nr:GAF domain-containing protein [Acidobacteria bacterium AH-259-D05]